MSDEPSFSYISILGLFSGCKVIKYVHILQKIFLAKTAINTLHNTLIINEIETKLKRHENAIF